MPITVSDIMHLETMVPCRVLGGVQGLHRRVTYTGSMEVPDIKAWLVPNQFLLTTGYALKDKPTALLDLIQDLHETNCSGLGIKTRFIGPVSAQAIALADELEMPLIEIPSEINFSNLLIPIYQLIADDHLNILEFYKAQAAEEHHMLMRNNLFLDIVNGHLKNEEEAHFRAQSLSWPTPPFSLLYLDVDEYKMRLFRYPDANIQQLKSQVIDAIQTQFSQDGAPITIITRSDTFNCILSEQWDRDRIITAYHGLLTACRDFDISITGGTVFRVHSYLDLQRANQQAIDTVHICRRTVPPRAHAFSADLAYDQIILQLSTTAPMQDFIRNTIGPLIDYDRENQTNLVETLSCYITNLGARAPTAQMLYLHRNTLSYRFKRIEQLLGCDLRDSQAILSFALALKAHQYTSF